MPKRLSNLKERFLAAARAILTAEGYAALSVRRLAEECDVATGTVYNYFRNKDELVAQIMMEDWRAVLGQLEAAAREAASLPDGLDAMRRFIVAFVRRYEGVWDQYTQAGGSGGVVALHHAQLRRQIAAHIATLTSRCADPPLRELAPLLAETLLASAVQTDLDGTLLRKMAERLMNNAKERLE